MHSFPFCNSKHYLNVAFSPRLKFSRQRLIHPPLSHCSHCLRRSTSPISLIIMKILFVGATGMIGGGVLKQCLAHPSVTSVVAFARRELPANLSNNPKLSSVIIKDFAAWPEDVLQAHSDAAGMIWYVWLHSRCLSQDCATGLTACLQDYGN